jgi:hypothetical protein
VHGSVLTLVGQNSLPISTAIRSLRQNSSSCCRRRAIASNVPSSKKTLFRLVMVPHLGDAVTRRLESSTRGRARSRVLKCLYSSCAQFHPAMWAFLGLTAVAAGHGYRKSRQWFASCPTRLQEEPRAPRAPCYRIMVCAQKGNPPHAETRSADDRAAGGVVPKSRPGTPEGPNRSVLGMSGP